MKLAEVLHFTQAAEACYVTQSGLSQQIKKLEDELGMALFLRIGKKVQLTEAGAIFLHHAKRILDDVDIGKQAIDDLNELIGGELKIGVTYVFGLLVLFELYFLSVLEHAGIRCCMVMSKWGFMG